MAFRRFARLLAVTPVVLLAPLALAGAPGANDWGHGHMWGWMFLGPLMMVAVIAAAVAIVVVLVRWLGGGRAGWRRTGALDILEERFARGEIEKTEFDERKRALTG